MSRRILRLRLQDLWVLPVYLWVSPCTLLGLCVLAIPKHGDRQVKFHRGTIGIFGPGIERILSMVPIEDGAAAMTIGHTILARDERAWLTTFRHEFVHVRQYQWFGPFFVPAYFLESLWQWFLGRHPYVDNRFEVQARKYETTI